MAKIGNFKQLLVEKGERVGFAVAAVLLVVFLALGGYVASTSASATSITGEFDNKIKAAEGKINGPMTSPPEPINPVVYENSTTPRIDFTRYRTPNEYFMPLGVESAKRVNPKILPLLEAQADYVRGAAGVYDITDGPNGKQISVIVNRKPTKNDAKSQRDLLRKAKNRAKAPPPPQRGPGFPGGGPGGGPGPMGGGGMGSGGGGGDGGDRGPGGMGQGMGRGQQPDEPEIHQKDLNELEKSPDQFKLAETLLPLRMIVFTGAVPYRAQVAEHARALRAQSPEALPSHELPLYRAFVVQRKVWFPTGQESDWNTIDIIAMYGDTYARTIDFEDETQRFKAVEAEADLYNYLPFIIPEENQYLLLPRPKLRRGQYEPIDLKKIEDTLKELKKQGNTNVELQGRNKLQGKFGDIGDLFNRTGSQQQGGGAGGRGAGGGDAGTAGGGGDRRPPAGPGSGGARPPAGDMGSGPPFAGGGSGVNRLTFEEAWLMRFIDIDIHPGYAYSYRVKLKAENPNFEMPVQQLAYPTLAKDKELIGDDWFTLPQRIVVPGEDFIYAATKDEKDRNKDTEKMPPVGKPDETYVQVHKWFLNIRTPDWRAPMGEWMIADIKAFRGQYIGETVSLKMPVWFMTHSQFLFRENVKRQQPRGNPVLFGQPQLRPEPVWPVDFSPAPPTPATLLVDFEGGRGRYPGPKNRQVDDEAAVEMLLLGNDGKLRVIRSDRDLLDDEERRTREKNWKAWLDQVQQDTLANKNNAGGQPGGPPGGPGGDR
jgi:hypothetical protein